MRWIFDIAWLGLIAFMAGSLPWLPEQVGDPGKTMPALGYLALMLPHALLAPWVCTRGISWIARKHSGLMNMPHKDYWLAEPRREASIAWLSHHGWGLGLGIVLLFALAHYAALQPALPDWPKLGSSVWLAATGLLLVYVAFWARSIYKRFPAPPKGEIPARSWQPRRPYRS